MCRYCNKPLLPDATYWIEREIKLGPRCRACREIPNIRIRHESWCIDQCDLVTLNGCLIWFDIDGTSGIKNCNLIAQNEKSLLTICLIYWLDHMLSGERTHKWPFFQTKPHTIIYLGCNISGKSGKVERYVKTIKCQSWFFVQAILSMNIDVIGCVVWAFETFSNGVESESSRL